MSKNFRKNREKMQMHQTRQWTVCFPHARETPARYQSCTVFAGEHRSEKEREVRIVSEAIQGEYKGRTCSRLNLLLTLLTDHRPPKPSGLETAHRLYAYRT